MTAILYGIANCDTIKKARAWLDAQGVAYRFHDYKKAGVEPARVAAWTEEHGWEVVLNRAGTTFRNLPAEAKTAIDAPKAIALMVENPSMIKRPIFDLGDRTLVGFKPESYAAALGD